jgi:hypothetical protein
MTAKQKFDLIIEDPFESGIDVYRFVCRYEKFQIEFYGDPGALHECRPRFRGRGFSVWMRRDGWPSWNFLEDMENPVPWSKLYSNVSSIYFLDN